MFPQHGPGFGLLLLRLCVAGMLAFGVPAGGWLRVLLAVVAVFVATGAFTAIAGVLAMLASGLALLYARQYTALDAVGLVLVVALILLGPGAYSIDARLFGRREWTLPSQPQDPRSKP